MWKAPVTDIDKVDHEALKIIYDQAIIRFEECASETESITDKTYKMLVALVSMGAYLIVEAAKHRINICISSCFVILYLLEFIILFKILTPRQAFHRGLYPHTSFPVHLDEDCKDNQKSIVYKSLLETMEKKISDSYFEFNRRVKIYTFSIWYLATLIILSASWIGYLISHP